MTRFDLDHVARRLAQHLGTHLPDEQLTSAVLAPFTADPEPTLLFTRRAARVAHFPGEVSFPGGRREPHDRSLLETALRETQEEIGVARSDIRIVGRLDDHHAYGTQMLRAYVGFLSPSSYIRAMEAEVERTFTVPLATLARPDVYEGRTLVGDPRGDGRVVHYFRVPGETIWGATGRIVADLLAITRGWTPPSAPRSVASWREFQEGLG